MINHEIIILQQLATAPQGLLTPEPSLHAFVNMALAVPITQGELRSNLASLESLRHVTGLTHEGVCKWKITANGRARLQEVAG